MSLYNLKDLNGICQRARTKSPTSLAILILPHPDGTSTPFPAFDVQFLPIHKKLASKHKCDDKHVFGGRIHTETFPVRVTRKGAGSEWLPL